MMLHKANLQAMFVTIICTCLFLACRARSLSGEPAEARVVEVDLESLGNPSKSYLYFDKYEFFPMRPGPAANSFFQVYTDSAYFTEGANTLYVKGRVVESIGGKPMEGVQIVIGKVQHVDAKIIGNDRTPPVPTTYYRMIPQYEDTTNAEGEFSACAKIDLESSLMIARKGFFLELYQVGKLVDSAGPKKH